MVEPVVTTIVTDVTSDPTAPEQSGPIDPGMTTSGKVVVTSIDMGTAATG
jgi:hypothetical protein